MSIVFNKSIFFVFMLYCFVLFFHKMDPGIFSLFFVVFFSLGFSVISLVNFKPFVLSLGVPFSMLVALSLVNFTLYGNFPINAVFCILNVGVAYGVYRALFFKPGLFFKFVFVFQVIVVAYFLYRVEVEGALPDDLLANSRNHITILLGAFWIFFFVSFRNLECNGGFDGFSIFCYRQLFLIGSFLVTLFLIYVAGRTAVAFSAVVAIVMVLNVAETLRNKKFLYFNIFVALVIVLIVGFSLAPVFEESRAIVRISEKGLDDIRWFIIYYVLSEASIMNFILGFDSEFTVRMLGLTPHNSFLESFIYAGLVGFVIILAFFVKAIKMTIMLKDFQCFLVVLAGLMQCFFDTGTFYSPLTGLSLFFLYYVLADRLRRNGRSVMSYL